MAHELKFADAASQEMARRALDKGIDIIWDRYEAMPAAAAGSASSDYAAASARWAVPDRPVR